MRKYPAYSVIFMLFVSIVTNGLNLSFKGEVFADELDHIRQVLSPDPTTHLKLHQNNVAKDGTDLDATTHLCLHSVGQYQPFFFNSFLLIPDQIVPEVLTVFVSAIIPEALPDLPLRPPRINS
ncbi:MAG: hypothetical protein JSR32_07690 [Proteobacteria bacterium]|nr:hypothetical protein [Pseudomonadota bacterium]